MQRAILEVERRFFGNTNDHHTFSEKGKEDDKVVWSSKEKASAFLDMQLLLKAAMMNANEWKESKNLLQDFYVAYYFVVSMPAQKQGKVINFFENGTKIRIVVGIPNKTFQSLPDG